MAATWDSAYLLAYFNRLIGRSATDTITPATKYQMLSEAQNEVHADIVAVCPHILYPTGAIPTLTLASDLKTATFGTDPNLYAKFPMGHGNVYQSLNDIPTSPFVDYMNEGTQIRALNNGTLPAALYWYGISQPIDISATDQPVLFPEASRELIGIRAAYNFGSEGNRNPTLSQTMAVRYGYVLSGKPGRFDQWCLTWKTQFARGGMLTSITGRNLAIAGQGYGYNNYQWAT